MNNGNFQPAAAAVAQGGGAQKNDGGFRRAAAIDKTEAKGNGNFQPAAAPVAQGGGAQKNDGGFRRAGEGPSAAAQSAIQSMGPAQPSAPKASAKAPCEGCSKIVGVSVAPGTKATIRAQLQRALDSISSFVVELFDAAILEAPGAAPAPAAADHDAHSEPWRQYGFTVSVHEGSVSVSSVVGDTQASRAGLEVGDVFALVEDISGPATIEAFSAAWAKGNKWKDHRVRILRHGAPLDMSLSD